MSEFVLSARNERESMLAADGNLAKVLRHPDLKGAYYSELYSVSDECITMLDESCIYDGYFANTPEQAGVPYLSGLIASAKGRPFIQECRTSSRIGVIKNALGGCHVYLWRNPWDQWWSYKVDHYFDNASQMCINGAQHPDIITRLIEEVGFKGLAEGNIYEKFSWFFQNRLSPDNSYLVFYVLWFLGLKEGLTHTDSQINIDRLSDSLDYRNQVTAVLEDKGVEGLDFSDCSVPQAVYGERDRAFFQGVEERAHGLLLLSGTSQHDIDEIIALRNASEPLVWHRDVKLEIDSNLIRDAERARELVLAVEQRAVDARVGLQQQLRAEQEKYAAMEEQSLVQSAEVEALEREKMAVEAERVDLDAKRAQLDSEQKVLIVKRSELVSERSRVEGKLADTLVAADAKVASANTKAIELEHKLASKDIELEQARLESIAMAAEFERKIHELLTSTSWRLTRPLRVLSRLIKGQGINLKVSPLLHIKHKLKSFISRSIRKAVANPRIKGWAVGFLSRRPVLKAKLKRIAWGMQQNSADAMPLAIATVEVSPSSQQRSGSKRKGNGDELKSPLESFFY
ncbi:hypothetical protein [Pseudomonas germanica]|jgi:hypothetical protein|uniref:hypothetical protein n=1 Tax=Pseudomonas germanica TaxID=2815720 RepID=UPI002A4E11AF|nr:hypothetical protein [Pseudomonas germanica]WPN73141.1 hypothetical protein QMK46_20425 [Pseudomonas germanica]